MSSSMSSPVQGASSSPGNVVGATSSPSVPPHVVPGSPGSSQRTPAGSRHRTPGSFQQRGSSVGPSPARSVLGQRGQARVREDVNKGLEDSSSDNIHTFIWGTKCVCPSCEGVQRHLVGSRQLWLTVLARPCVQHRRAGNQAERAALLPGLHERGLGRLCVPAAACAGQSEPGDNVCACCRCTGGRLCHRQGPRRDVARGAPAESGAPRRVRRH
jgi:hypothetical protein